MRTPPPELPPVPEGWTYIGNEAEINIDGCETDFARAVVLGGTRIGWGESVLIAMKMWWDGTSEPQAKWHYIAVNGSRLALLNGGKCLCGGTMVEETLSNTEEVKACHHPGYKAGRATLVLGVTEDDLVTLNDELHAIIGRLRGDVKERDGIIDLLTVGRDKLIGERDTLATKVVDMQDALDRWQAAFHDAANRADKLEREKWALRESLTRSMGLLNEYVGG